MINVPSIFASRKPVLNPRLWVSTLAQSRRAVNSNNNLKVILTSDPFPKTFSIWALILSGSMALLIWKLKHALANLISYKNGSRLRWFLSKFELSFLLRWFYDLFSKNHYRFLQISEHIPEASWSVFPFLKFFFKFVHQFLAFLLQFWQHFLTSVSKAFSDFPQFLSEFLQLKIHYHYNNLY